MGDLGGERVLQRPINRCRVNSGLSAAETHAHRLTLIESVYLLVTDQEVTLRLNSMFPVD